MAAATITRQRTNVAGARKIKTYTLSLAASGDTHNTRLRKIESVSFVNPQAPFSVSGVLVGGTVTLADARIAATDLATVSNNLEGGTVGDLKAVPGAGSVVITSESGTDTSTVAVTITKPSVTKVAISAETLTFTIDPAGAVAGLLVRAEGN